MCRRNGRARRRKVARRAPQRRSSHHWVTAVVASIPSIRRSQMSRAASPTMLTAASNRCPSEPENRKAPSSSIRTSTRPLCTWRWWKRHSITRFDSFVSPPLAQCRMWWPSRKRVCVQPGNRQQASRDRSARRIAGGMVRVLRPISSDRPDSSSTMVTRLASQDSRRAVCTAIEGPLSISQRPGVSSLSVSRST